MLIQLPCISVRQPWAWLIANGIKDVENRTWQTEPKGWLAIHASKTFDHEAYNHLSGKGAALCAPPLPKPEEFQTGAIIGIANHYANIVPDEGNDISPWHEYGFHGWLLREAYTLDKPIPWKGQLGIFKVGIPAQLIKHQLPTYENPIGETKYPPQEGDGLHSNPGGGKATRDKAAHGVKHA